MTTPATLPALGNLTSRWNVSGRLIASGLPGGLDAAVLPDLVAHAGLRGHIHVCLDDQSLNTLVEQLGFFAPTLNLLRFPAWDCLPYDRVSPATDIVAQRLSALAQLARPQQAPLLLLTTVNAMLMRTVAGQTVRGSSWSASPGNRVDGN
ncbi:MAG: transcription-repair coupling factor, partial [Phyllobacteriaceae bacterium]|nr:transcription-repair coupling factor [Phyllobacteriaceae bacterium]